ncbi:diacylglycerol kinase family protein [Peribacillus sp. NPDC096622]|uniref:diacylglycerol kinase family protein n=1 Tax=Peribacillus sp. NPDC096622 TaxID=3364396 RepID=UPI0037F893BE
MEKGDFIIKMQEIINSKGILRVVFHYWQHILMSFPFYNQSKKAMHAVIVWEYGEEMEVVFVLGGDGTVHEFVNGLSPPLEAAVVWDFTWRDQQ